MRTSRLNWRNSRLPLPHTSSPQRSQSISSFIPGIAIMAAHPSPLNSTALAKSKKEKLVRSGRPLRLNYSCHILTNIRMKNYRVRKSRKAQKYCIACTNADNSPVLLLNDLSTPAKSASLPWILPWIILEYFLDTSLHTSLDTSPGPQSSTTPVAVQAATPQPAPCRTTYLKPKSVAESDC